MAKPGPKPKVARARVAELLAMGLSVREVSKMLDITTQRVYQIKWALDKEAAEAATDLTSEAK